MSKFLHSERGVTLVELSITMVIVAILGSMMVGWIIGVGNADIQSRDTQRALDELRFAKSQMVKEIRFADGVVAASSDSHTLTLWIDDDAVGIKGTVDASIGEVITWQIESDGRLTRDTDLPSQNPEERANTLVYDASAAAGTSFFAYPAPGIVGVELVADVDSSTGPSARTIRTQIHLRNA